MNAIRGSFALIAAAVLVVAITGARAGDGDPLSTVQALMDAEQAFDLDRAMSLFSDDAVIVNAAGARTAGADSLKLFLDEDMWFNDLLLLLENSPSLNKKLEQSIFVKVKKAKGGW